MRHLVIFTFFGTLWSMDGDYLNHLYYVPPQETMPANCETPFTSQTSGPPPSPLQASFPSSPPAHKNPWWRTKFGPRRVLRSIRSHCPWEWTGTSTEKLLLYQKQVRIEKKYRGFVSILLNSDGSDTRNSGFSEYPSSKGLNATFLEFSVAFVLWVLRWGPLINRKMVKTID